MSVSFFPSTGPFFPAPFITHTPVEDASPVTQLLQIEGVVSDQEEMSTMTLVFRHPTTQRESRLTLPEILGKRGPQRFAFVVPKSSITSEGLLYRIEASNVHGSSRSAPSDGFYSVRVRGYAQRAVGRSGATVLVPDGDLSDGQTALDIPAGALETDTVITIEELGRNDPDVPSAGGGKILTTRPASAYRLHPEGTKFKRPVTLRLLYPDKNQDGLLDNTDQSERLAQIFLFAPGGWEPMGGKADTAKNEVSTRLMHFSVYAVFPAMPAAAADLRPTQKVITPGSQDNKNDMAVFGNLGPDAKIDIFDDRGARVRTLRGVMAWDGRDDDGEIVESGVYIYQYDFDGKTVSGVIAVAR